MKQLIFTCVIALLLLGTCARTEYWLRDAKRPVRFTAYTSAEGYQLKSRFAVSRTRHQFFWGMVHSDLSLDELLSEAPPNSAIGNLEIIEKYTFFNAFLDFWLMGFYRPYTVLMAGDIYEKTGAPEVKPESKEDPGKTPRTDKTDGPK